MIEKILGMINKIIDMIKKNTGTKKVWIAILAVIVVAVGAFILYRILVKPSTKTTDEPEYQTAVARRGDLVVYASGTGIVQPSVEASVGSDQLATLEEVLVKISDQVKAGDVLARLQSSSSAEARAASVAAAELNVVKAEKTLQDLYTNAGTDRATILNEVITYTQGVRDAQYNLNYLLVANEQSNSAAWESLQTAREDYEEAWKAFDPYKYSPKDNEPRESLLEALDDKLSNYDTALKRLNYEYNLEAARANLESSKRKYDSYDDGPDPVEIKLAEADLANAKANLEVEKANQSVIELKAPIAGSILEITANVGEPVDKSPIIKIGDLNSPFLEVYLDETDLDKVEVGYKAKIVFDAFPDDEFTGHVVEITPSLQTVSNVATLVTKVDLDPDSYAKPQTLPVGLNASVEVIGGEAKDAVLIPVEALRKLDTNEYGVFVVQNGELSLRQVSVGIMDFTTAEIKSGIKAGEVVSTGLVKTK